jgi:hypothetical protein
MRRSRNKEDALSIFLLVLRYTIIIAKIRSIDTSKIARYERS